uniref:Uncharacterized protein n=1 Tax=Macrostomum lignano TaxID=282301 RepID=A0A1I8IWM8_9PLAT
MRPRIRLSRSPIDGFRSRTCWLSVQPRRQRNQAVLATTKKIIKEAATAIQRLMRRLMLLQHLGLPPPSVIRPRIRILLIRPRRWLPAVGRQLALLLCATPCCLAERGGDLPARILCELFQLGRRLQLSSSHPLHQHQQLPLPPLRRDLRNQPLPPPQPGRSPFRAASSSPSSRICQSRTTTGRSRPASRPTMRDFPAARPPELTKSLGFITAGRPPPGRCSPMDLPLTTCLTRQLAPRQLRQRGRRHRPTRWTTLPRNTKCRSGGPPDDRRRSIGRAPAVAVAAAAVSLPAPAEQLRVRRQQRPALPPSVLSGRRRRSRRPRRRCRLSKTSCGLPAGSSRRLRHPSSSSSRQKSRRSESSVRRRRLRPC